MLRFKRPPVPPKFKEEATPYKQTVADFFKRLRKKTTAKTAAGGSKSSKKSAAKAAKSRAAKKAAKKAIEFEAKVWQKYKTVFASVQFDKCGFCESDVTKTGYGDVEHYRPKGEIWERDPSGKKVTLSETGYWWMAYEWDNYLFACAKCNQANKGSYFPVAQKPRRVPPSRRKLAHEQPLLLNPYDPTPDPAACLELSLDPPLVGWLFERNNSAHGKATIDTCGLNRVELVRGRAEKATSACHLALKLRRRAGRRDWETLRDAYNLGRDDTEHTGMVRMIFEEVGGLAWHDLVAACAQALAARLRKANATRHGAKHKQAVDELEDFFELMGRERLGHSDAVRTLYESTFAEPWDKLLERRARQVASDLRASPEATVQEKAAANAYRRRLLIMARDSPPRAQTVVGAFEAVTGLKWADLQRLIENTRTS